MYLIFIALKYDEIKESDKNPKKMCFENFKAV